MIDYKAKQLKRDGLSETKLDNEMKKGVEISKNEKLNSELYRAHF